MTPLLRISSARAEHQTSTGVWALVLRAMRAHPGRIIVAAREPYWHPYDGPQPTGMPRIIYVAARPTTARGAA